METPSAKQRVVRVGSTIPHFRVRRHKRRESNRRREVTAEIRVASLTC
jgi:hypothetical protein